MAVKIARQTSKIILLGAPTSAAATLPGREGAPAALRASGLAPELQSIGYEITDLGDDPARVYKPDEESPRAKNLPEVIAGLETLKPRVEQAVKSGGLLLILSGDASIALATIAGARRYFRNVSMIYMARDGGLHTPATTPTGSVDGMVVSHLTGRGAAELVRFWGEPPLVREPDLALFGTDRLDPAEEQALQQSPVRRYLADDVKRSGPSKAAKTAIDRVHGNGNPFVLHLDVDVISDFQACDDPGSGGLRMEEVREALEVFAKQDHLIAIEISGYNPAKDSDGSGAKLVVSLLAGALRARKEAPKEESPAAAAASAGAGQTASGAVGNSPERNAEPPTEVSVPTPAEAGNEPAVPSPAPGEAWPSESLEPEPEHADGGMIDMNDAKSHEPATQPDESES